jgi:predicted nuclease of predicted toxin-antitoxin system
MNVLVDMNLTPRWVGALLLDGFQTVHWSEIGPADAPDAEIFRYAREKGYVILTQDLDFGAMIAAAQSTKPSVVQIRSDDLRPESLAPTLVAALRQMASELEAGALVTIDARRTRIRILPLD